MSIEDGPTNPDSPESHVDVDIDVDVVQPSKPSQMKIDFEGDFPSEEILEIKYSTLEIIETIVAIIKEQLPGLDESFIRDKISFSFLKSLDPVKEDVLPKGADETLSLFEVGKAYEKVMKEIDEYIGGLVFNGLQGGRMPMPVFYFYSEKWLDVCKEKSYTLQEKAKKILTENAGRMLDIVTPPDANKVRIYDFGVGTGEKGKIIIDRAIKKRKGKGEVEYHGVDSSPDMLRIALEKIAKDYMQKALEMKDKGGKIIRQDEWKNLIRFLKKNHAKFSDEPEHLENSLQRIFGYHYAEPENYPLLKFSFARMISLHKKNEDAVTKIRELDELKLPLSLHAHAKWFQQFKQEEFVPEEKEGVVIFDLGSEICNQFPGKSIEMFYKLLSDPKTPEHEDGVVPLAEEKEANANYVVLGLQLGEIPKTQAHFRATRTEMRKAYNNEAFRELTSHPFKRHDMKYADLETGNPVKFEDIGFVYADYEEDNDHPGYYGATHRLYITEDVEVTNVKGDKMEIKGKEAAYGAFKKVVEAMFDPEKEADLQGKRLEIMRVLGVSNKEELLAVDPKVFYSKDYSHYGSGIKVAEKILREPVNLRQTLLYPSYKPTLELMVELCHERGMKIIEVYPDDPGNPTYVKILARRMTQEEKDLYESCVRNPEIFYTLEPDESIITSNMKKKMGDEPTGKTVRAPGAKSIHA